MRDDQRNEGDATEQRVHAAGPLQGRVTAAPPAGTTPSHERPSFRDPVADNMDPTSPESPESTMPYDRANVATDGARMRPHSESPQDNLEDWRRVDVGDGA